MEKKYIIKLEENEIAYKTVNSNGRPMIGLLHPSPYTEPDTDEEYQRGLNDAWAAARKIALDKEDGGLDTVAYCETFGFGNGVRTVLKTFTASEAIEKIRAYEQKEEIQVGDEVKCIRADWTAIVTKIKEGHMILMGNDGAVANGYNVNDFVKTGRHFPEIAEVLRKMKENSDGNL